MTARRVLPALLALALGVACAALVACAGTRDHLIPPLNADQIERQLTAVQASVDQGDCASTGNDLDRLVRAVDALPSSVDARLRRRLHAGVANLQVRAPVACANVDTITTTTPIITTDTTPTVPTTPTEPTTPTVPTTPTEPTTPTVPTTPTTPDGTGGAAVPGT